MLMEQYYFAPTLLRDHQIKVVTKSRFNQTLTRLWCFYFCLSLNNKYERYETFISKGKQSLSFALIMRTGPTNLKATSQNKNCGRNVRASNLGLGCMSTAILTTRLTHILMKMRPIFYLFNDGRKSMLYLFWARTGSAHHLLLSSNKWKSKRTKTKHVFSYIIKKFVNESKIK